MSRDGLEQLLRRKVQIGRRRHNGLDNIHPFLLLSFPFVVTGWRLPTSGIILLFFGYAFRVKLIRFQPMVNKKIV